MWYDSGLADAEVKYMPHFLDDEEADGLMATLLEEVPWKTTSYNYSGRDVLMPRLTAWYGDEGAAYKYSGTVNAPLPWTHELAILRDLLQEELGVEFNSVLLNLYRSGKDSVAWHSDDEKELGVNPTIASVSLGDTRKFRLKSKSEESLTRSIDLVSGSLLVMSGETQKNYLHCVPKTAKIVGQRINLTYRKICP